MKIRTLNEKVRISSLKATLLIFIFTLILSSNSTFSEYIFRIDNLDNGTNSEIDSIVNISKYDKFTLDQNTILEHNLQYEDEIMSIHKQFIREIVKKGYLCRIDQLVYEKKLEKYHIESRIEITDSRFNDASKIFYTSLDVKRYQKFNIHNDDIIYLCAYIATDGGCIEEFGGSLSYSIKEDFFYNEKSGNEKLEELRQMRN